MLEMRTHPVSKIANDKFRLLALIKMESKRHVAQSGRVFLPNDHRPIKCIS
jgi:hypothetical protein